ncbi:alanine dehydrogenase [Jannaschia sp. R86511]|uniref:alanine dehydrogenase n=1 Tax=Jannaschia sp. R86511 TaxID=3093853 RepID=UPI0036D323E3
MTATATVVGVPSEVKNHEYRVALTPSGVHELRTHGHEVLVQAGAGAGSSITDDDYRAEGAVVLDDPDEVWGRADVVLKVKEPVEQEYHRLRPGLTLFTYLHLAADRRLTEELVAKEVTAVAYETVQTRDGSLPLLYPMSEVAGRLAPMVGAHTLMRAEGGRGVLMGGVSGTYAAKVVVIGAGVSGLNATATAVGMQAEVVLMDRDVSRLRAADRIYQGRVQTVASNPLELERAVLGADLVIGAVLVAGAKAPKLVSNELVSRMRPGSVLVDISVDQGGCFADTRPTTHAEPTFPVHDSVFYCVANMPGAVPNTSTYALTNVTLPYASAVATRGWREALQADPALALGLNTHAGAVVNEPVAVAHGMDHTPLADVLA